MDAESGRRCRDGERGQVMVVFILIFMTCMLMAAVAVAMGQMLVRRHQAQAVVDAAAFSGAAEQARGLNTIARFNEKSLHLLRALYVSSWAPYIDSTPTTTRRLTLIDPFNDWAGDVLRDYQHVFEFLDAIIRGVNIAYSLHGYPSLAAGEVIGDNFTYDESSLFRPEDFVRSGAVHSTWDPYAVVHLVRLTDRQTYDIGGYYYSPDWLGGDPVVRACLSAPPPVGPAACVYIGAVYGAVNADTLTSHIRYDLGRFYDNPQGTDVRFAYYLTISGAPALFGSSFLGDLPKITVIGAAKPYGGYLGHPYSRSGAFDNFDPPPGKETSPTYQAKLVPATWSEIIEVGAMHGFEGGYERWMNVFAVRH